VEKDFYIIDTSFLAFRAYFTHKDLCTKDGIGTGMPYGLLKTLIYLFMKYKIRSSNALFVYDGYAKMKKEIYPNYKSGRKKQALPREMSIGLQLKISKMLLAFLGVNSAINKDEESDDVIGTIVSKLKSKVKITIVSNDHDFLGLLDSNVKIMRLHKAGEEYFTDDMFLESNDITPDDYWKIQALGGCTTDKVPGMPNIGEERAYGIVKANSWEKIVANHDDLVFPNTATKNAFRKNFAKWNIDRDIQLVKLKSDVKYELKRHPQNKVKLREWFVKLGFKEYLNPPNFLKITELFE